MNLEERVLQDGQMPRGGGTGHDQQKQGHPMQGQLGQAVTPSISLPGAGSNYSPVCQATFALPIPCASRTPVGSHRSASLREKYQRSRSSSSRILLVNGTSTPW